ncbi:hypothetical protein T01_10638 [Trichinella spiralis]|uniref:Uncharacterized protein n=1 Tax=Trichinella spiralis TaxID=6334 RepID=A0A0V1BE06_TRISP|nr:hypothetical protein T01_10638 [Trichinella spiralis]
MVSPGYVTETSLGASIQVYFQQNTLKQLTRYGVAMHSATVAVKVTLNVPNVVPNSITDMVQIVDQFIEQDFVYELEICSKKKSECSWNNILSFEYANRTYFLTNNNNITYRI